MTPSELPTAEKKYSGASVLITGGTGSFGQAMTRRLLGTDCGEIRVLSRDEAKQDAMRRELADGRLTFYLGDVRNPAAVERACRGAQYVFHAAALKQVPSCEFFPVEAVATNILGSANVIEAARLADVRAVVCLGTDKAVYPINAMGMTKALMEKVAQAHSRHAPGDHPVVSTVRYGNVLYSRGSVVPLFVAQARARQPLTITDPAMTRFLMLLDDAIDLVEHAFLYANRGDLFVRKAAATTIDTLASVVGSLFGDRGEVKIERIGTRHGEKLYETLVSREEMVRATDEGDYFRIPLDERSLNYETYFSDGDDRIAQAEEYTSHNAQRLTPLELRQLLQRIPEIQQALSTSGSQHAP